MRKMLGKLFGEDDVMEILAILAVAAIWGLVFVGDRVFGWGVF